MGLDTGRKREDGESGLVGLVGLDGWLVLVAGEGR